MEHLSARMTVWSIYAFAYCAHTKAIFFIDFFLILEPRLISPVLAEDIIRRTTDMWEESRQREKEAHKVTLMSEIYKLLNKKNN